MAKRTNALGGSTSPYLLQHQHNPVHWRPWSPDAWQEAQDTGKLVLISVGYSACHWCHVMEHETFEDEEAATFMNAHFVCLKVDREERPDVDQVYMEAVQQMTRQGGWPLHCVALPDGRPIWGGTYFPKDRWLSSLQAVLDVCASEPQKVEAYAHHLASAVAAMEDEGPSPEAPWAKGNDDDLATQQVDQALHDKLNAWRPTWDMLHGGAQGSPKFPLPCQIDFLRISPDPEAQAQGLRSLDGMERGGIHDHVGGGFARYSVDEKWHVPHFEKMLYDNAQLLGTFSEAAETSGKDKFSRAAEGIARFLLGPLGSPEGGFASALDADSDGAEGTYYVWSHDDLAQALPNQEMRDWLVQTYDWEHTSHWEEGRHVLMRPREQDQAWHKKDGQGRPMGPTVMAQLAAWRDSPASKRSRPAKDDKVVTGWTALAVSGFARAGRALQRKEWTARALQGGAFLLHQARMPGHPGLLRRTWHPNGGLALEGFSEDYAFTVQALLDLHQVTLDPKWRDEARALMATALDRFWDDQASKCWFTSHDAEPLFARRSSEDDSVTPSASATLAGALWKLGWACDIPAWRQQAQSMVQRHLLSPAPLSRSTAWAKAWMEMRTPMATMVIAAPDRASGLEAAKEWWNAPRPGTWLDLAVSGDAHKLPWMEGKEAGPNGEVQWYVCWDGACQLPVTNAQDAWMLCPTSKV